MPRKQPYSAREHLAGIRAKVDRAEELLNAVDMEMPRWVAKEHPWDGVADIGDGNKRMIVTLKIRKPIDPRFGVIGGEIVHDLRSALDHLVCYLVKANHAEPSTTTAWPFETSRCGWRRKVERRQAPFQLWRKKGGGPLKGIPIGTNAWALIEGTQPYHGRNSTRNQAFWMLHQLWNADKHRIIHTMPISTSDEQLLDCFQFPADVELIERKALVRPYERLQDNTKLVLYMSADPFPPNMQVQFKITFQVSLGDYKWRGVSLRDAVAELRAVTDTIEKLAPPRS